VLDLPHDVVAEWSRWCRTRDFLFGDETLGSLRNFATFRADLRLLAFRDDPWCSAEAVEHLARQHAHTASREVLGRGPDDDGGARIGHVGSFREGFRETLWREAADWLLA